jgi:DGQHR domain-containing protein
MARRTSKARVDPRDRDVLLLPALEIQQGPDRRLYTFAIDGKQIPSIATVARVRRDDHTKLQGYQRPEVVAHVTAIRKYIESDSPLLPNAVVIAFDDRVHFVPSDARTLAPDYVQAGTLVVPVGQLEDENKPGFIVDGQQRCAAIRDAQVAAFPICVTAFITSEHADQRSQFILVNSTKPLPKGLIHELLPGAAGALPTALMVRRLPAALLEQLNFDDRSPLHRMIQTPTNPGGVVKDNSVLRMLENSLSDGVLYRYRDRDEGLPDTAGMIALLHNFWAAAETVFPEAWNKPPRRSRLMHGAGIISMGFVMDAIADAHHEVNVPDQDLFATDLKAIRDHCHWTEGTWEFDDGIVRAWNDIQNTPRDVQRLADFLVGRYRASRTLARGRSRRGTRTRKSD